MKKAALNSPKPVAPPSSVLVEDLAVVKPWPNNYVIESCPIQKGCICDPNAAFEYKEQDLHLSLENVWKQIAPLFFCICLKSRNDRLMEASQQFHQVGLCRLVRFFRPERPDENFCKTNHIQSRGLYGCWTSHHLCAELAKQAKVKRLGIFEDDALFRMQHINVSHLKTVAHDINDHLPEDWDMFKLGQLSMRGSSVPSCHDSTTWYHMGRVFRVDSTATHAFVWSQRGIQKMAASPFSEVCSLNTSQGTPTTRKEQHIDQWMRKNMRIYACYPQLVVQSNSQTSNTQNGLPQWQEKLWLWFMEKTVDMYRQTVDQWDACAYYLVPFFLIWLIAMFALIVTAYITLGCVSATLSQFTVSNEHPQDQVKPTAWNIDELAKA